MPFYIWSWLHKYKNIFSNNSHEMSCMYVFCRIIRINFLGEMNFMVAFKVLHRKNLNSKPDGYALSKTLACLILNIQRIPTHF